MLGPVLGQLIYSGVKYAWTFYIFAFILAVSLIIVIFIIPSHLNHVAFDNSKQPSMVESKDGEEGNRLV
jgi:membrane protein YdbS with pleckstrin-like domain